MPIKGQSPKQIVHTEMHKFKHGQLHSGSKKGPLVKSRKQAIAIALSESGQSRKKYAEGGNAGDYNTPLNPAEEQAFQAWKRLNAPNDSGVDYDLRGAFKGNLSRNTQSGHWNDQFKKPNHPTFSDESQYSKYGSPGFWTGQNHDVFVPPSPMARGGDVDDNYDPSYGGTMPRMRQYMMPAPPDSWKIRDEIKPIYQPPNSKDIDNISYDDGGKVFFDPLIRGKTDPTKQEYRGTPAEVYNMYRQNHPHDEAVSLTQNHLQYGPQFDRGEEGRAMYASGGMTGFNPERSEAYGLARQGMLHSNIPGRTDKLNLDVPTGSYIVPADITSALGQGNSLAGESVLNRMFTKGPYGMNLGKSRGPRTHSRSSSLSSIRFAKGGLTGIGIGAPHKRIAPIVAAGGEYVVHPDSVARLGNGNLDLGHDILDAFVKHIRDKHIKTLKGLKPPKGSK